MKLNEMIKREYVVLDFEAKTKADAIAALVGPVVNGYDKATLIEAILEREKLGSTGVGQGVGVPHVRIDEIKEPKVVFGRSSTPVEFESIDDAPCTLFFLVLGPTHKESQDMYLQTMAKISRLMRDAGVRAALEKATDADAVVAAIAASVG